MKKLEISEEEVGIVQAAGEDQIELIDYLRVVWKRRKLIFLGTALSILIAGGITLFMPPRYEATAQIRIGRVWDKDIENPYLASELIMSDSFLTKVIQKLSLNITPYKMKDKKIIEVRLLEGGTVVGQKLPVLVSVQTHSHDPQEAVDLGRAVGEFVIEEHRGRFQERLKEYQSYEKDLEREVTRIEGQLNDLEVFIKKQSLNPTVSAPSVILLQAQLEQKSAQLLNFKKELKDARINNSSSMVTEETKLIAPPVLPKEPVNLRIKLTMAVVGAVSLLATLILSFFLEYLEQVRIRELRRRSIE